ncbi:MAG: DUF952 domain-containing protein [Chloroflexi bacterium]|nr:DUF952 domain-containing protein [Chloroflexota bacterium]
MMLHLVSKAEWEALPANQPYAAPSLEQEGFIHCTDGEGVMLDVANRFYRGQSGDFVLLEVDEVKVMAPVKREAPADPKPAVGAALPPEVEAEHGESVAPRPLFPHVYGPIDRAAIVAVRPVLRDTDGRFTGFGAVAGVADVATATAANPLGLKPASQLANELLDATDAFSESLRRYKDKIEARIDASDRDLSNLSK